MIAPTPVIRHFGMDSIEIIYTSRKAKGPFMESLGRKVYVWIDDKPQYILYGDGE